MLESWLDRDIGQVSSDFSQLGEMSFIRHLSRHNIIGLDLVARFEIRPQWKCHSKRITSTTEYVQTWPMALKIHVSTDFSSDLVLLIHETAYQIKRRLTYYFCGSWGTSVLFCPALLSLWPHSDASLIKTGDWSKSWVKQFPPATNTWMASGWEMALEAHGNICVGENQLQS